MTTQGTDAATETPAAPEPVRPFESIVPRDGGTLLGAATVLGFLSFVSNLGSLHLGSGRIPLWAMFAVDASIAGAAGAILTLGSRWFLEPEELPSADFVVVARPVWQKVQAEVLAARGAARKKPTADTPGPTAPVPPPTPGPNPWDEGPPISLPAVPPTPTRASTPAPAVRAAPVSGPIATSAGTPPAPTPALPSRGTPVPAASTTRAASPAHGPAPRAETGVLTAAELEQIARMGGILGIVPLKGESGAEYSERLAKAREALARPEPSAPAAVVPEPPSSADLPELPQEGESPDIDELMHWLDTVAAERTGEPAKPREKKESDRTGG